MANIHKGKKKLKDTSIEDIAMKNSTDRKHQVFFKDNNPKLILDGTTQHAIEAKRIKEATDQNFLERQQYNNRLLELDPLYSEDLKPLRDTFIVRFALLPQMTTSTGLMLSGSDRSVATKTKNGHIKDYLADPWEFQGVCVIVASPEHEKFLVPGMLMQTPTPVAQAYGEKILDYKNAYLHPASGYAQPPKSPTDRHYGYGIVSTSWFRIQLSEDYFDKYIRKDEEA